MNSKEFITCTSKFKFNSRITADKVGKRRHLRVYRCRYCKGWHLTHQRTVVTKVRSNPKKNGGILSL